MDELIKALKKTQELIVNGQFAQAQESISNLISDLTTGINKPIFIIQNIKDSVKEKPYDS